MELAGDEPGVIRKLHDLDQAPGLVRARDDEPGREQLLAVDVVDLVTVPVALVHDRLVVGRLHARSLDQFDRARTEAHRAAHVVHLFLLRQEVDHRIGRFGIHLG